MKTTIKLLGALLLFGAITISSCKKDPDETTTPATPAVTTGSLTLHLENMVDTNGLVLNTKFYTNANNDTFNVTTFKYNISNIVLTNSSGLSYTESNSYHLIDASDTMTCDINLTGVPLGNYDHVSFMIGVDSVHNVSGAQTGALDPANGMFWSWSSGYIMAKFEGTSPQSTAAGNIVLFHCGGFSGVNNVLKTVSPTFPVGALAMVSATVTPEIHFSVDLAEWFKNPSNISFSTLNTIHMPGASAKTIADNYADMFSIAHIHN